jgi:hypothetical protein
MKRYIQDPALADRHGAYNLARREQFDEATSIDRLEAVFTAPRATSSQSAGRPVVICGSASATHEVGLLVDNAYKHLESGPAPVFIWHDWADVAVWRDAKLLWLWDRHLGEELTNTAFRRGVPVLAPRSDWTEGLARHYGGVILYDKYVEALAAMRALFTVPTLLQRFASLSQAASSAATEMAPSMSFHLPSERSK